MISDLVRRLVAAGCDPGEAAALITEAYRLGATDNSTGIPVDVVAEKRRAYDRARKRKSTGIPPDSAGIPIGHIEEESNKRTPSLRGTRIPPEWSPSDSCRSWALSAGLSHTEIDAEAQRFKDWWSARAGKDATKTDWDATWRNWCRNFLERSGRQVRAPTTPEGITPEQARIEAEGRARREAQLAQQRSKANGKDPEGRSAANGSGTESAVDQGELLPPR